MRWLKYTFIGLTSLLIAAVAMLLTLVVLLDQNRLRDGLVYVVNRSTDHQLQINGPLLIDLSRSPVVQVSDITFKTATDDFKLDAAEIHLQVDISSLWSNYLIVRDIFIKNCTVSIRQSPSEEQGEDFDAAQIRIPVIEKLSVENLVINYSRSGEIKPLHINLQSLNKHEQSDKTLVALTGTGTIDGTVFKIEGKSGTAAALLTTDQPYPFNYHFEVLQAVIHAEGKISNPRAAGDLDIALQISASGMQDIMDLLHVSVPDIGSLEATATLTGTLEAPRLDDIDLRLSKDKLTLQLSGRVGNLFPPEDIELDFSSAITDAELLASLLPEQSPRFNSVKTSGKISGSAGALSLSESTANASDSSGHKLQLAGSTRIIDDHQPLRDLTATLSITAPDTTFARQFNEAIPLLGPVAGTARVSMISDVLQIDGIKLTAGNKQKLQIAASGEIKLAITNTQRVLAGLKLDIDLQAPSTASLTPLVGTEIPALGVINGVAHVSDTSGVAAVTALDINIDKGKDLQVAVNGSVADLEKLTGIDMKIELTASDLNTIGQPFDQTLPKEGAVKYSGRVGGSVENVSFNGRVNLRNTTIGTDLTATFSGKRPRLAGSVNIPDLDLHDIGIYPEKQEQLSSESQPKEFDQVASEQAAVAEDLFSKEPIDFSGLNAIDLDLKLTINKLSSTASLVSDIYSHVLLNNGKLEIKPLKYSVDNDVINNEIMVNAASEPPAASMQVTGDDIDLGLLLGSTATESSPVRGIMTAKADMRSRGHSPAELAANLDGEINIVAENARIAKSAMNLLTVDVIGWAISNVFTPNKDVNIGCAIFIMHFDKGLGATDLHIIDTPDTLIKLDTRVNLVDQTMDITIVPEHKRRLFKTKKDPMEIYGPIANPQYKLVSVKDLAQETSRAALLAPLTISTGILDSLTSLIVKPDEPKPGSCDKFLK